MGRVRASDVPCGPTTRRSHLQSHRRRADGGRPALRRDDHRRHRPVRRHRQATTRSRGSTSCPASRASCRPGPSRSAAGIARNRRDERPGGAGSIRRAGDARAVGGADRQPCAALGLWFTPVPNGLTAAPWHLFALFAAAIFAVVAGALPILTASLFADCRRRPRSRHPARGSVVRLRQRHHRAHHRRVPGRPGGGQVRPRRADRPRRGAGLRPFHAGAVVQPVPGGRGDRAGLPEQHRAIGRAVLAGRLAGRHRRRAARRSVARAARRAS